VSLSYNVKMKLSLEALGRVFNREKPTNVLEYISSDYFAGNTARLSELHTTLQKDFQRSDQFTGERLKLLFGIESLQQYANQPVGSAHAVNVRQEGWDVDVSVTDGTVGKRRTRKEGFKSVRLELSHSPGSNAWHDPKNAYAVTVFYAQNPNKGSSSGVYIKGSLFDQATEKGVEIKGDLDYDPDGYNRLSIQVGDTHHSVVATFDQDGSLVGEVIKST